MVIFIRSIFLSILINVLGASGKLATAGWQIIALGIVQDVPMYTVAPRFILSIRELYARDVQGRRGEGIDTGFGFSLSDRGGVGTAIMFAAAEQNEGLEDVEETPMGVGMSRSE